MKNLVKLTKKAIKVATKAKFAFVCFNVGATVHSLIPKYDKITDIDTDKLIQQHRYNLGNE